ncbi:SDR family NAD(P)-dependent oxidoreductase [Nocardia mexicana]|uniref:3-oxoacyl-[acyl-carrier protein] reductase n=1 Tax=Nocardia mexicana TaxID=279262 RepID=A0A370H8D3_9NOCA|nr:SDR family NAD(P)-dependent oxidoreductase [Nocardia mexicana]RDI50591.1 3-oxoacyl-[acyl-carrier protein] reductase [Nocardia mexicana]
MLSIYSDLPGKVAVVTGGSRGIGAETARMLAAQGVRVCVVGRDPDALDAVAAGIAESGGTALGVVADVTDAAALARVATRAEDELGPIDILCAFAGGQGAPIPSTQLTEARWRQVLDSDLTSAFLTVQAFLPGMVARGRGSIIGMSSAAGRQPSRANLAYGVANAGLVMLARHLATEFGPDGVRVNTIAPTSIRTEKVAGNMPEEMQRRVAAMHPLRRLGTTADVAETALFLASDASSYLTGLTLDVAGGRITN